MKNNTLIWIEKGYEIFAIEGVNSIKIEPLSKVVGKNKSSFYHYFADINIFIDELLNYHLTRSEIIAEKESNAISIVPDIINILIEHKTDLLFNRQLRFNRNIASFNTIIMKSDQIIGKSFLDIWEKELNLKLTKLQIETFYSLALDNFYLNINHDNINYKWLSEYFLELNNSIKNIC